MHGTTTAFPSRGAVLLLIAMLSTAPCALLEAQPNAWKTGGTSGSTFLLGSTSAKHSQVLFTSSDLTGAAAGNISTIYFRYSATNSTNTLTNLVVKLGQTTGITFSPSTTFFTGLTTVFSSASFTIPAGTAGDWFAIPLTTPFTYTPSQTLIVDVMFDGSSNTSFSTMYTTGPGSPNYKKLYSSTTTATTGTTSTTWQDFGMLVASGTPLDAALDGWTSPVAPLCPGTHPVTVTLKNIGTTTLTSATIQWTLNGVSQTPLPWTGSLAQFGTATVTLGSASLSGSTSYDLRAWVTNPNSGSDGNPANDTTRIDGFQTSLSAGTYTIGGTAPDFPNFLAARNALVGRGICGPVVLSARPGSYNEQLSFPAIPGASSTNTVTFQSEALDSSGVTLTWAGTGTTDNFVVELLGASWMRFRHLTMAATGASYARVLAINGPAQNISVSSCVLQGMPATSTSNNLSTVYNASGAANISGNITIENCRILNGSYGLYWYGSSQTEREVGHVIRHNEINGFYYYGMNLYYQKDLTVLNNTVTAASPGYTTNYGMDVNYCDDQTVISRNRISLNGTSTNYGMYLYYCDGAGSTAPVLVSNNFISVATATGTAYGIYSYNSLYQDIIHNSINVTCGSATAGRALYFNSSTSGSYGSVRSLNNIAVNTGGGVAVEVSTGAVTLGYLTASNNNCYYATGTVLGRYNGTDQATLAALQTASGLDGASVSMDPGFVSSTDLHISTYQLNAAGIAVASVTDDVDGESRHATTPDIGADEFTPITFDAGVVSIDKPTTPCPGVNPVEVTVRNFGILPITSFTVVWDVNGVQQTPVSFSGSLAPGNSVSIPLGDFLFSAGTAYTITAATSMPNGLPDPNTSNDAAVLSNLRTSLSGSFTLGGTAPDFATFADAAAALSSQGVCGPVTIDVRPGTYTGRLLLDEISGSSPVNQVVFRSSTGIRTDVVLQYDATGTGDNAVVLFNGTDHVILQAMTFVALDPDYGRVVEFDGMCDGLAITDCTLQGVAATSTSSNLAVVYNTSGAANMVTNCRIDGNSILGGSYSMYWYGSSSTVLESGNVIRNNRVLDFYYYGLYLYYQDAPVISHNVVRCSSTPYTTTYGIYPHYCENGMVLTHNDVHLTAPTSNYGIYVYYSDAQPGMESLVANNFVTVGGTSTAYGIYSYYSTYQRYFNNSVLVRGGSSTGGRAFYLYNGDALQMRNNIAVNTGGGYAVYASPATNVTVSDNNNFFTTGGTLGYWGTDVVDLAALQVASGLDGNSVSTSVVFADGAAGDLHLAGTSIRDLALRGAVLTAVTDDIDGDIRRLPFMGADEGCYIPSGMLSYEFTDASGSPIAWAQHPGTLWMRIRAAYPAAPSNITVTIRFYDIASSQLRHTATLTVLKPANAPLDALRQITLPASMPSGFYRVEVTFNTLNSCDEYADEQLADAALLIVDGGTSPCLVWPGDVNNDGLVNYGDRKALNMYIFNANLRPTWLQGPARYRPDAATNPLTYFTWEAQPGAPWATSDGCYMDCDGNGTVNSYDFLAMRVNWLRSHGTWAPKPDDASAPGAYDLSQNYPNPFNPSTSIRFTAPERSRVRLIVHDMLGRTVATLVDGTIEAGVHTVLFTAAPGSGSYLATITMTGQVSGSEFTRSIRMTMSK